VFVSRELAQALVAAEVQGLVFRDPANDRRVTFKRNPSGQAYGGRRRIMESLFAQPHAMAASIAHCGHDTADFSRCTAPGSGGFIEMSKNPRHSSLPPDALALLDDPRLEGMVEMLIILKFQRLLQDALPLMKQLDCPLLASAHDFSDFIVEFATQATEMKLAIDTSEMPPRAAARLQDSVIKRPATCAVC
jgi:hypothetical protein